LSDNSTRDLAVKLRGAAYGSAAGRADRNVAAVSAQVAALRAERVDSLDTYRQLENALIPRSIGVARCSAAQYWCCAAASVPKKRDRLARRGHRGTAGEAMTGQYPNLLSPFRILASPHCATG